jgi:hypothetical protein
MPSDPSKQNFENLWDLVNDYFPTQPILKYFPYGPETQWSYWLTGTIDLRDVYKEKRNKNKTEKDYIFSIVEGVARAMNYLTVHSSGTSCFDRQRLEAHAMWSLFHSGDMGWSKDNIKGLSKTKLDEYIAFHKNRSDQVYGHGKYADDETKKYEAKRLKEMTLKQRREHDKFDKKHKKHNLKEHGVYEVRHFPLIPYSNTRATWKSFYTKQQLAAIDIMVACAFENLC